MTELKINSKRRGVSPIIATLMLIAITVVGGILIFVFSQGFFNTNQVTSTNAPERLSVTSWNFTKTQASSSVGLTDANGAQMYTIGSLSSTDTALKAGDWVVVQVRNGGNTQVPITKVTINGIAYTFGGNDILHGTASLSALLTGTGHCDNANNACFIVTSGNTLFGSTGGGSLPTPTDTATASASLEPTPVVPAGKTVSIAVELNGKDFAPIKIGSTAIVQITTGGGNTVLATATSGLSQ